MPKMPLAFANTGNDVVVMDVLGEENMCKKLKEMGFVNGSKIRIVKNDVGPVIIKIGDSRIVLGRSMASKIMIGAC